MENKQKKTNVALVTLAIFVATFMSAIEGTIVSTAMPTIIGNLNGIAIMNWVFSIYLLTSALMTPIYGKLSDMIGRKPVFIAGLLIFIIGSSLCGLSQSMGQLIAFRAVQGIGAGAIMPVTSTIIADIYPFEERAKIMGLNGAAWGIAGILGPLLGGFIVDQWSWHWIFYINIPVGLAAVLLVSLFFHEDYTFEKKTGRLPGELLLDGGAVEHPVRDPSRRRQRSSFDGERHLVRSGGVVQRSLPLCGKTGSRPDHSFGLVQQPDLRHPKYGSGTGQRFFAGRRHLHSDVDAGHQGFESGHGRLCDNTDVLDLDGRLLFRQPVPVEACGQAHLGGQLDDPGGKRAVAGHLADCNAVLCLPVHHRPDWFGDGVDDHDNDGYRAEYCAEGTDRDSDIRQHSFPDPWADGHGIHLRHRIEQQDGRAYRRPASVRNQNNGRDDEPTDQSFDGGQPGSGAPADSEGNPLCGYPQRLLIWFPYRIIGDGHQRFRQKAKGKLKHRTHPSGWVLFSFSAVFLSRLKRLIVDKC